MGYEKGTPMKHHDFSRGPVWDEGLQRHVCDLRLPNGRRIKRRFKRERQAVVWWRSIAKQIDDGTWNREPTPRTIGEAFDGYRKSNRVSASVCVANYKSVAHSVDISSLALLKAITRNAHA
jgi:hypothetical protein